MCCHIRSASVSRRRHPHRHEHVPLPSLAMLDLSKPGEKQAHDFLLRATNKRDRMWTLLRLHRQRDMLLCVVQWVHPDNSNKPFSLAEVSLTELAVCWQHYATVAEARSALTHRCGEAGWPQGTA